MLLSKTKTIALVAMTTGLLAVSTANAASPLTIQNNTDQSSTSIINHGACSSTIKLPIPGFKGITPPHQSNIVPATAVNLACGNNQHDCQADIFMDDACGKHGGAWVATISLDTNTGVKGSVDVTSSGYHLTASQFNVTMNPAMLAS